MFIWVKVFYWSGEFKGKQMKYKCKKAPSKRFSYMLLATGKAVYI